MTRPRKPRPLKVGVAVEVGLQSWAGLTWHMALVEKVCPKRYKVRWLSKSALRHEQGRSYYVPHEAVRRLVT